MLKPTTTNHQLYPLKSRFLFCPFCFKSTACFSEKPQKHFPCHCGFMHWSQHTLPRPLTREQSVRCDSPVQSPAQQVSLSCFCCCCDTVPFSLSHLLCLSLFHRPSLFLAPSHFGLPFPILRENTAGHFQIKIARQLWGVTMNTNAPLTIAASYCAREIHLIYMPCVAFVVPKIKYNLSHNRPGYSSDTLSVLRAFFQLFHIGLGPVSETFLKPFKRQVIRNLYFKYYLNILRVSRNVLSNLFCLVFVGRVGLKRS